jgi:hypothetical protein
MWGPFFFWTGHDYRYDFYPTFQWDYVKSATFDNRWQLFRPFMFKGDGSSTPFGTRSYTWDGFGTLHTNIAAIMYPHRPVAGNASIESDWTIKVALDGTLMSDIINAFPVMLTNILYSSGASGLSISAACNLTVDKTHLYSAFQQSPLCHKFQYTNWTYALEILYETVGDWINVYFTGGSKMSSIYHLSISGPLLSEKRSNRAGIDQKERRSFKGGSISSKVVAPKMESSINGKSGDYIPKDKWDQLSSGQKMAIIAKRKGSAPESVGSSPAENGSSSEFTGKTAKSEKPKAKTSGKKSAKLKKSSKPKK